MAENSNILITVTADDSGAITKINKLGQEINTAGDASKSWIKQLGELKTQLNALDPKSAEWAELAIQYKELGGSAKVVSQSFEELKAQASGVGSSIPTEPVKNFRQQIKELTNELQTSRLDKTSDEYKALQTRLSELKDAQKDFNEEIGANAGPAFESAGNNLRNLQSRLGSLDFAGAADSIKGLTANIKNLNFSGATEGAGSFGKSLLGLGKALLTNPIFLIGSVLALLITNFDKLANIIPGVGIAFEAIGKVVGFVKDAITGFTDAIGLTTVAAANAIDSAIGGLEDKQKVLDNARRLAVANAQKTGADVAAVNKQFQEKQVADNEKLINEINALEKKGVVLTAEQIAARKKLIEQNTETQIKAAENEASEIAKVREDAAKKAEDAAKAAAEKAAQEAQRRAELRKQREAEVTDAIKQAEETRFQNSLSAEDRELRQVELKYQQLIEKAANNQTLVNQLEEQRFLDRQTIRDKFTAEEIAAQEAADLKLLEAERANQLKANEERIKNADLLFQVEQEIELRKLSANEAKRQTEIDAINAEFENKFLIIGENAILEAELIRQQNEAIAAVNQEFRDSEKAADEKSQQEKLDGFVKTSDMITKTTTDGLSAVLSLNDAFSGKSEAARKRSFERNKALQIGLASIQTYQSAVSAYASQVIPGDPTSVVRGAIAAAAAVAAGLANIAKIKSQKYESAGGGGGGGGGGGNFAGGGGGGTSNNVPQFNPLAVAQQNINTTPRQTYVLASDVASAMEARERIQDLSRL
jgi:hypothetical protein